ERDKPRPPRTPAAPVEDDPLGKLSGGVKPGDKHAADGRPDDTKGYLTAITRPVSQVMVDGADTGQTTPISGRSLPLSPGKHKIVFVYAGGKLQQWIKIKAGETVAVNKDLH